MHANAPVLPTPSLAGEEEEERRRRRRRGGGREGGGYNIYTPEKSTPLKHTFTVTTYN